MPDEVPAFSRSEEPQRGRDQRAHVVEAAWTRGPQKGFQFGERLFDGIAVGTVGREEAERGAGGFNGGANRGLLMDRQVVEHDHVAGPQRRDEDLVDIRAKRVGIDRAVKDARGGEPLQAQRCDHGVRLPLAAGRVIVEARPAGTAAISPQQVGGDAALIEKDVLPDVAQRLPVAPVAPGRGDVRPTLFVGVDRFF